MLIATGIIGYSNSFSGSFHFDDFTQVILLHEDFPEAWANRGITRRKQQQYGLAIAELTRVITLYSCQPGFYYHRGLAWWQAGNKDSAWADMQKASRLGIKLPKNFLPYT